MAERGYARTSLESIADRAGITKPTIYLRYPGGKAELATAALASMRERSDVPESGDTRSDLIVHLRSFRAGVERPFGMSLIGTVLAEERQMPELLELFRQNIVRPRRRMIRAVLERARKRGELRAEADLDLAVNMLVGSYYAQYLAGRPFSRDWPSRAVETLLSGLGVG